MSSIAEAIRGRRDTARTVRALTRAVDAATPTLRDELLVLLAARTADH